MRRAALGDSPDTSKALRSLVAAGLVQREGRGGRSDTFRYKARSRKLQSPAGVAQRMVKGLPGSWLQDGKSGSLNYNNIQCFVPYCGYEGQSLLDSVKAAAKYFGRLRVRATRDSTQYGGDRPLQR